MEALVFVSALLLAISLLWVAVEVVMNFSPDYSYRGEEVTYSKWFTVAVLTVVAAFATFVIAL